MDRPLASNPERSASGTDTGERTGLNLKTALLGLGAIAVGYVIGRRLSSGSTDDLRERAGEALPGDGVEVPIGGTNEGTAVDPEEEIAGVDPTLEEVDERTGEDVEETPAEPGEMQVDEEAVDADVDEADREEDDEDRENEEREE